MRLVAGAAPDGCTIILSSESNPHPASAFGQQGFRWTYRKSSFRFSAVGQFQHTLIVKRICRSRRSRSWSTISGPIQANCRSDRLASGTQAHIAGEFLSLVTQSRLVHVPYPELSGRAE